MWRVRAIGARGSTLIGGIAHRAMTYFVIDDLPAKKLVATEALSYQRNATKQRSQEAGLVGPCHINHSCLTQVRFQKLALFNRDIAKYQTIGITDSDSSEISASIKHSVFAAIGSPRLEGNDRPTL